MALRMAVGRLSAQSRSAAPFFTATSSANFPSTSTRRRQRSIDRGEMPYFFAVSLSPASVASTRTAAASSGSNPPRGMVVYGASGSVLM